MCSSHEILICIKRASSGYRDMIALYSDRFRLSVIAEMRSIAMPSSSEATIDFVSTQLKSNLSLYTADLYLFQKKHRSRSEVRDTKHPIETDTMETQHSPTISLLPTTADSSPQHQIHLRVRTDCSTALLIGVEITFRPHLSYSQHERFRTGEEAARSQEA